MAELQEDDFFYDDSKTQAKHTPATNSGTWKVLVADDEAEVHDVTILALSDFNFMDRGVEFLKAYSGEQTLSLIKEHPDTALILLDVVMEEDDSGLVVTKRIREELKNSFVRIILRTGQPGQAPEKQVVLNYDINNYLTKSELTAQKLFTSVVASLRAYNDIMMLESFRNDLEILVRQRTNELIDKTAQLENLNHTLENRVQTECERRMQSEQMLVQKSKMASMGEMISVIAHQWRQPLNDLALLIQDIEDAYDYNELTKEYIKNIVKQGMDNINFLSQTIDDFRNFLRPAKKKAPFNIIGAIGNVLDLVSAQLKSFNIEVIRDFPDAREELVVSGYPNEFKHVILNVVNNAKDSILEKREKFGFTYKETGKLTIAVSSSNERVNISIKDDGIGLQPSQLEKIFEPYYSTKEDEKGTGIGLYMSRVIVENNMNGKLYARCLGNGAEFVIELNLFKYQTLNPADYLG